MKLSRVDYRTLNPKQKEIFNFQKVAALLADYGFNCIKLADDWQGADFLAYKSNEKETLKVQLKSRITINKKYLGKNIWVAFPFKGFWYLIEHDSLVKKVRNSTNWLNSKSWKNNNGYSSGTLNAALLTSLAEHKLQTEQLRARSMAALTIKNIPDKLCARLKESAAQHRRSINGEAISCLEKVLAASRVDPRDFLAHARSLRERMPRVFITERDLRAARRKGRP